MIIKLHYFFAFLNISYISLSRVTSSSWRRQPCSTHHKFWHFVAVFTQANPKKQGQRIEFNFKKENAHVYCKIAECSNNSPAVCRRSFLEAVSLLLYVHLGPETCKMMIKLNPLHSFSCINSALLKYKTQPDISLTTKKHLCLSFTFHFWRTTTRNSIR